MLGGFPIPFKILSDQFRRFAQTNFVSPIPYCNDYRDFSERPFIAHSNSMEPINSFSITPTDFSNRKNNFHTLFNKSLVSLFIGSSAHVWRCNCDVVEGFCRESILHGAFVARRCLGEFAVAVSLNFFPRSFLFPKITFSVGPLFCKYWFISRAQK